MNYDEIPTRKKETSDGEKAQKCSCLPKTNSNGFTISRRQKTDGNFGARHTKALLTQWQNSGAKK